MDKYLIDILLELSTIVIPDFGALSILNKETGEISFVPFFKHNDGQLAKYISQKEGITEMDATNMIAKYVREIEAKLNQGESYDIFQFGSFRKSTTGLISFIQYVKPEATDNTKEIPLSKEVNEAATPPVQPEIYNEKITENKEVKEGYKEEDNVSTVQSVGKEELLVDPAEENHYSLDEQWNDDLELPPLGVKKEQPKKPILEKMEPRSKRKGPLFYGLLVAFVLLLGGGSIYMLFYNSLEKKLPLLTEVSMKENDSAPQNAQTKKNIEQIEASETGQLNAASGESETTNTSSVDNASSTEETINASINTSSGPYHVIAGAFSDPGNAERFSQKLNDLGFDSKIVANINNLNMVSISSFSDKQSAEEGLQQLSNSAPGGWILYAP